MSAAGQPVSATVVARGRRSFVALHAACGLMLLLAPLTPLFLRSDGGDSGALGLTVLFGPPMLLFALVLFDHARLIARSRIVLDDRGITLNLPRFGGLRWMRGAPPVTLAWPDLGAVHRRPRGARTRVVYYVVVAKDGAEHTFTRTVIARPNRVAAAIAARAGLPLVTC